MIYVNLLIDYLFCNLIGINSYLVLIELDRRKLFDVVLCGLLIDLMYGCLLINTIVFVGIYYLFKFLSIKKKYIILKNILIILVYVIIREILHIFL